jgi:hypothetical protein
VAFSANQMGYSTGYGKNFGYIEEPNNILNQSKTWRDDNYSQDTWAEVLGLDKAYNNLTYSLGIGYPDESLEWYESKDNDEYLEGGPVDYSINKLDHNVVYSKFSTTTRDIKVIRV